MPEPSSEEESSKPMQKGKKVFLPTSEDVDEIVKATLKAWNTCPTIVKKQLDDQYLLIKKQKEQIDNLESNLEKEKQHWTYKEASGVNRAKT